MYVCVCEQENVDICVSYDVVQFGFTLMAFVISFIVRQSVCN